MRRILLITSNPNGEQSLSTRFAPELAQVLGRDGKGAANGAIAQASAQIERIAATA